MLKVIHLENPRPISLPVDITGEFEPGMAAQLKTFGNDIVAGVSDGTAPFGLIDDARTVAFTKMQIDEVVEISVTSTETNGNGQLVNSEVVTGLLDFSNIIENSFISTLSLDLSATNGAVIIEAGTPLNYDSDGDGTYDSFRLVVNYAYKIPSKPGEDTTVGSGRVTVFYSRGWYATDQYDPKQAYPLNATLYIGLDGKFTTKQPTANHPGIAMITAPPSSLNSMLEFLWF